MRSWTRRFFRRTSSTVSPGHAHLTFGATSVGRTLSRTSLLLKKQLWLWPIIAMLILAVVGYGINIAIERTMEQSLRAELETLLNVERSMLETWLRVQESNAESLANDQQVREIAALLLAASQTSSETAGGNGPAETTAPDAAALNQRLGHELAPGMSAHDFVSYFLADKEQKVLASSHVELIGQSVPAQNASIIGRALSGESTVSPPFPSAVMMKDEFGVLRAGVPTMHVCVPLRDANFQVVAVLGLRIRPEREFTRILQLGQVGETGETYAIDKTGMFCSNSRFDEELILLGLLPDVEHSRSIVHLSARDPGVNMQEGARPGVRRSELPLTRSAAAAISGTSGVDIEGHRDYRGVPVVGAWTWLPNYDMGVITEIDYAEAYRPLTILRWAFFSLFGLLLISSAAIFVFMVVVARLQRDAQRAVIEAKHLGQYRLEERIGAGAMGVVYKGCHAMLRRPTAIKMLNVDKVNDASMERFEREVQITCKLNHPSTVAIFDYGRTPEGVFYYAMEYLDGLDLQSLVDRYGPQPEGRVIRILKQVCGSLYEAHSLGLVHRDIKPANVMLNRRGGEPDVVKVLDFGLVKAIDDAKQSRQSGGLAGTPLYMSPESIQTPDLVDARSDLYAVGAVGYFLLTGQPVFNAASLVELCQQHVTSLPDAPSQRLGKPVSVELESAILACLEKSRAKRPQTARDLAALLDLSPSATSWTLSEAEAWWGRHDRSRASANGGPTTGSGFDGGRSDSAAPPTARSAAPDFQNSDAQRAASTKSSSFEQTMASNDEDGDQL